MGAGASAADGRVFCHSCGARTASSGESKKCGACGATEDVEVTDSRLPVTSPTSRQAALEEEDGGASSSGGSPAAADAAALEPRPLAPAVDAHPIAMRVESVTVVATHRREDDALVLRILPNVVACREVPAGASPSPPGPDDAEEQEEPQPACAALVARLSAQPAAQELVGPEGPDACVICCGQDAEKVDSLVVQLACGHVFHDACIRSWLAQRHTCPTCRFELEVDSVKHLRAIGLLEEADALETLELEKKVLELELQAATRRRWALSMRRGDPVHFGLVCSSCAETPVVGDCFRCQQCEGYTLCGKCHGESQGGAGDGHPADHELSKFGAAVSDESVPHGAGGVLTVVLPASAQSSDGEAGENPGEAALAAAEAAFAAVQSLAFAASPV